MPLESIVNIAFVALVLISGVMSVAILYHINRYSLNARGARTMSIAYGAMYALLLVFAVLSFLSVDWAGLSALLR